MSRSSTVATSPDRRADEELTAVRPTARQLAWQAMEFYGFVHFGMNTMTDREWGEGGESPTLFDPTSVDTDQWMRVLRSAGMTGAILTAKHHDGFCLWPSGVTAHSVASSPWRDGRGDLVAEFAASARIHGLRFGVYLSPWDRTEPSYGSGVDYDDFYVAQLTELLTGYGEVFSVWFDGANGEGPDGRRQTYDWDRYYDVVRRLQPGAVINVCGPDVRWCGNEAGHTRVDEWSVVPRGLRDVERIASRSQQVDDGAFAASLRSDDEDLGSRAALAGHEHDLVWYPAEVNTSIRPGWFHHHGEDAAVRDADELFALHRNAVGGNAAFLLNVPPAADGRLAAPDVAALQGLGVRLADQAARTVEAPVVFSSGRLERADPGWAAQRTAAGARATIRRPRPVRTLPLRNGTGHWRPDVRDPEPRLTLRLPGAGWIEAVVLKEEIALGQRIEQVEIVGRLGAEEVSLGSAGAIGYQRVVPVGPVLVDAVELRIRASRGVPAVAGAAVVASADGDVPGRSA